MASTKCLSLRDNNTISVDICNIKAITTSSRHIIAPTQQFHLFPDSSLRINNQCVNIYGAVRVEINQCNGQALWSYDPLDK